jgi:hypothetical protein
MIAAWILGVIAIAYGAGVSTGMRIEQRERKERGRRPGEGVRPDGPMPAATMKPRDAARILTREERQAMVDHYFESDAARSLTKERVGARMDDDGRSAGPRGVYDPGTGTWRDDA